MRRTGNDFASPATAIEACGGGGMTKVSGIIFSQASANPRDCEELLRTKQSRFGICAGGLDCVASLARTKLGGGADRRQHGRCSIAMLQTKEGGVAAAAPQQIVMA